MEELVVAAAGALWPNVQSLHDCIHVGGNQKLMTGILKGRWEMNAYSSAPKAGAEILRKLSKAQSKDVRGFIEYVASDVLVLSLSRQSSNGFVSMIKTQHASHIQILHPTFKCRTPHSNAAPHIQMLAPRLDVS